MPSIDDVFNELQQLNTNLGVVHADLSTAVKALQDLAILGSYADLALSHLSQEGETIICSLDQIGRQTCNLLNEAHTQSAAQDEIRDELKTLLELGQRAHPAATVEIDRLHELDRRLDECCPPTKPDPICIYKPCDAPPVLVDPPDLARIFMTGPE